MENPETLKIPNFLCQQIFDCQFEIDVGNISEDIVSKTVELYSQAINFYLNKSPMTKSVIKRVDFYQQKIKKLLNRGQVQQCLLGKNINNKSIDMQREVQKIKQSAPEQAKAIIQYYKSQTTQQQNKIKKAVQQQDQRLKMRIQRRSRSKTRVSEISFRSQSPLQKKLNGFGKQNGQRKSMGFVNKPNQNEIEPKRKINSFKSIREKNTTAI